MINIISRESSFNMTRGGDENIEGGLRKFVYFKTTGEGGGAPKKLNR